MKISIIGGGSVSWTPGFIQSFIVHPFFNDCTICLMDVNPSALATILPVCELFNGKPNTIRFQTTTDLDVALQGADYVIVAISHGGFDAELEDHRITRKHGYYNIKGSEVGIAGCSRTLRHVPEMVRIARLMERHCPKAMLLNVTNPLTALTRAINKYTTIKSVGFCHGVKNHLGVLFPLFGATSWEGVDYNVAGVDHCSWLLSVKYKGKDALQILRDKGWIEAARQGEKIAQFDDPFAGKENQRLRFLIWDIVGCLPAISDEHCVEFFGQLMKSKEVRQQFGVKYDRIVERANAVEQAHRRLQKIIDAREHIPVARNDGLELFIAALNGCGTYIDPMNYRNEGQVSNLPLESVVETKCLVDATGVHPIIAGPLPPILETISRPVILREELFMEAAMENNFQKLRAALAMDPLVNDFRKLDVICQELLDYNNQFRVESICTQSR